METKGVVTGARFTYRAWNHGPVRSPRFQQVSDHLDGYGAVQNVLHLLAWIIHDECRARRKPLILLSYAAGADFVEFSATKSSDRPFPWSWPASGQPGA